MFYLHWFRERNPQRGHLLYSIFYLYSSAGWHIRVLYLTLVGMRHFKMIVYQEESSLVGKKMNKINCWILSWLYLICWYRTFAPCILSVSASPGVIYCTVFRWKCLSLFIFRSVFLFLFLHPTISLPLLCYRIFLPPTHQHSSLSFSVWWANFISPSHRHTIYTLIHTINTDTLEKNPFNRRSIIIPYTRHV